MIKVFFITRSTKHPVILLSRKNHTNIFLNYDAQAMIKCIHDRELRRSESIYILQEIPNHQLCTVLGTVRNNLSISRTQRTENKVTRTQRRTPTWDPTPGLISNVSFRLRPCLSLTRQARV